MRKFKKQQEMTPSRGEIGGGISCTVPDQSMSIRTIIQRFAQGIPTPLAKELQYSEDLPDIRGMDITQLYEMREISRKNIETLQSQMRQLEILEQDKKRVEREKNIIQLRKELGLTKNNPL